MELKVVSIIYIAQPLDHHTILFIFLVPLEGNLRKKSLKNAVTFIFFSPRREPIKKS